MDQASLGGLGTNKSDDRRVFRMYIYKVSGFEFASMWTRV